MIMFMLGLVLILQLRKNTVTRKKFEGIRKCISLESLLLRINPSYRHTYIYCF